MSTYATVTDVQARMLRDLSTDEQTVCAALLADAAAMIDAAASGADANIKLIVSCRMVIRALGDGTAEAYAPIGATQGSQSALGYSNSWTIGGGGGAGELYIGKAERQMLGIGNRIGSYSPAEELAAEVSL